jgi:hypothetical protein
VWEFRLHVPEIRNEFGCLSFVDSTEVWSAAVKVQMNMKHGRLSLVCGLKRPANRGRPHHGTHGRVIDIVLICDIVQTVRQYDQATTVKQPDTAEQEPDALGGECVRSR